MTETKFTNIFLEISNKFLAHYSNNRECNNKCSTIILEHLLELKNVDKFDLKDVILKMLRNMEKIHDLLEEADTGLFIRVLIVSLRYTSIDTISEIGNISVKNPTESVKLISKIILLLQKNIVEISEIEDEDLSRKEKSILKFATNNKIFNLLTIFKSKNLNFENVKDIKISLEVINNELEESYNNFLELINNRELDLFIDHNEKQIILFILSVVIQTINDIIKNLVKMELDKVESSKFTEKIIILFIDKLMKGYKDLALILDNENMNKISSVSNDVLCVTKIFIINEFKTKSEKSFSSYFSLFQDFLNLISMKF